MDWYSGSGAVNHYIVPRDQDLLDRHPSPDCWSNWGISATEGFNSPKNFFIMDFIEESFNNRIELEPCLHDKDQSSSSSVCGGLPEQSFQQTTFSCDHQTIYQLQDLPRFEQMNDIFSYPVPEDLPCVEVDNLDKSINTAPENQSSSSTPGILQKEIAASSSVKCNSELKDCPDTKVPPVNVSNPFEQCSSDDSMNEQSSIEEFILKDLEMTIGQFTERTRICFRDALYRLAKNTEQEDVDLGMQKSMPQMDHNEIMRSQDTNPMESETNSVDRVIANLMFNNMEFNMHTTLTSSANSMQQVIGSKDLSRKNSTAFNMGQKFHYPHHCQQMLQF